MRFTIVPPAAMKRRARMKTYAIEERMSDEWVQRWSGFTSLKKARDFMRRVESAVYGPMRIVRVVKTEVKL